VSVKWRPLSILSAKRFWKFCITLCSMFGEIAATSSLMFCFKLTVVLGFFPTPCSWDILRGWSIATRDTCSDEYWSADEMSFESRQNRCFLNTSPQQKPDALDQRSMANEMLWVSLEKRSRTNSPRQRFHLQLFPKIVRYFCRTL